MPLLPEMAGASGKVSGQPQTTAVSWVGRAGEARTSRPPPPAQWQPGSEAIMQLQLPHPGAHLPLLGRDFFNSFPSTPLPLKSLQPQRDVSFMVPQSPGAALHLALP